MCVRACVRVLTPMCGSFYHFITVTSVPLFYSVWIWGGGRGHDGEGAKGIPAQKFPL